MHWQDFQHPISIHSLVKRETPTADQGHRSNPISIHSLVKRETEQEKKLQAVADISIHSLVKRETISTKALSCRNCYFNPLPRKEGDALSCAAARLLRDFNPLPRKEGDRY